MKKLFILALIPFIAVSCKDNDTDTDGIKIDVSVEEVDKPTDEDEIVLGGGGSDLDESNSYLIAPGATVNIPVSRAYKVWSDNFDKTITGTPGVRLLWIDNDKGLGAGSTILSYELVSGATPRDAYISVKTGSEEGNALIAYTLDGDVYWSWHLWVTDYDPDNGGTTYYHKPDVLDRGHTFMDRSVGALGDHGSPETHGFLYQWGRKDPFPSAGWVDNDLNIYGRYIYDENGTQLRDTDNVTPRADGISDEYVTESDNIPEAVQNPLVFYVGQEMVSDWWGTGNEASPLWTTYESPKSVFDPCPVGWRVPSGEWHYIEGEGDVCFGPWSYVVNSTTDGDGWMFFRQFGYIPLYGDKVGSNGAFSRAIGNMSTLWTADYLDFFGMGLYYAGVFSKSGLSSSAQVEAITALTPNDGYSVRCERE